MTSLARLPLQLDRRTAEYLHREIAQVTRGSHYEWASTAIGRSIDSLCQVYTFEMGTLITAICKALYPTRLEATPTPAQPAPLEGWELVQQYNQDPSSLTTEQVTAACTYLMSA
jgi:hypothetical protein